MAVYAIGDIQGCFDDLNRLLKKINFKADKHRLWFTGDLVNRGPKSLKTLRFVKSLGDNAITVLGNHDLHLLAAAYSDSRLGKKDTLKAILKAPDRDELLEWLLHRPLMHHDKNLEISMVHAGLHPDWSIKKSLKLAREVEQVLRQGEHIDFFNNMYGDKPDNWSDELSGWKRYRFITNVMTRMRYVKKNGKIDLNRKGVPGGQPKSLKPWYEIKTRKTRDDDIIFGHWSTLALLDKPRFENVHAIDTGCVWGGRLTAMRIDDGSFKKTSINCKASQRPGDE